MTGDDKAVEEVQATLGNVEGAVVKWAHGFHSARTLTPDAANEVIRAATKRAIGRIESFKPFRVARPVRFDLSQPAGRIAHLPAREKRKGPSPPGKEV
jgi:D-amino peptidase